MDNEAPGTFDDGPRRSLTRMEEEADRKHDAMSNVMARPESLNDYLMHQIGELELEPELAAMAERIISALDASDGGYLKSSLEDLLPPDAGAGPAGTGPPGAGNRAEPRSARDRRARSARVPAAAVDPGHAVLRGTQDAHQQSPGRPARQSPAADRTQDRLLHRAHPEGLGAPAETQSQTGRRSSPRRFVPDRHARCDRSNRRTTAPTASCSKTPARRGCSSASTTGGG